MKKYLLISLILILSAFSDFFELLAKSPKLYVVTRSTKKFKLNSRDDSIVGLFSTKDKGKTWQHYGWKYTKCFSVSIAKLDNRDIFYLSCGNGVLKSGDGGKNWTITTGWNITECLKTAIDPTNPDPLNRIALAEARVGNYGIASQYAADAVDKDPNNPRLHGNLGRMYYRNGEIEKAINELRLAVQGGLTEDGVVVKGLPLDDPNDDRVVEFYYTYGLALAKGGQCDLANQIFQLLLNIKPDDEIVLANAQEGLVICGEIEPTSTPEVE